MEFTVKAEINMKKIAILHAANTFNNGSFMLLINAIQLLNTKYENVHFLIEFNTLEDKYRLEKEMDKSISFEELPLAICKISNQSFFAKAINLYKKIYRHGIMMKKMGIDQIVILGGDDFSEYYKGKHIRFDLQRVKNYTKNIPVVMLSQSIGPFYGNRIKRARKCLSETTILCREEISYQYCSQVLGLKDVFPSSDLAYLDLPMQKIISDDKKQIAIIPGGHYQLYTNNYTDYLSQWEKILNLILQHNTLKEFNLILLPHVSRPEDDRRIIKALQQRIENKRLTAVLDEKLPSDLRNTIGESFFTVSSRMHASISAFNQGKAAIVFAHSIKYQGIIGKALSLDELLIKKEAWEKNSIIENFSSSLDYLLTNKANIEKEIRAKQLRFQEIIKNQMQIME
jgi:colanic acid/amylovoran biosynthesis protein